MPNDSAERLEPLTCPQCRIPKTLNPHPDAGKPDLVAGYLYECIPCLVKTRASWAARALKVERELEGRAPAEAGAPSGWKLVPIEPTDEMQAAAAQAIRFDTTLINKLWTGNAVLRAGIAAAPAHKGDSP